MVTQRRDVLKTGLAAAAVAATPGLALAASGTDMRAKAQALLDTLDEGQRNAVLFDFEGSRRLGWNFMLGSRAAPGLALESMSAQQKDMALDLLSTGASQIGIKKAMNIMLQQDILRDEWNKGSPSRNRERFSLQIYGTPSATGAWTWRWEGHHLSLSFTLLDDEVIATTPSSYSSEPNTVPSGPYEGLVVLEEEESLARRLFQDLAGSARDQALVWEGSPGNILSNRGREAAVSAEQAGLALADMSTTQADMAKRLVEVYTTEVLPPSLAAMQTARLADEDMDAMRFAWGGANLDGSIYYRLTGQDVLIEFASLVNQPLHLHAVFHDTRRNFGAHML